MKHVICDERIDDFEISKLFDLGYKVIKCPRCTTLYDAVCSHPDMLIHMLSEKRIVVYKNMPQEFIKLLESLNYEIIYSSKDIKSAYPDDIILNALSLGNLFIHNLKFTDNILLEHMNDKKLINISQGYTKCSVAVINEKAVITSDKMIFHKLTKEHIDVLFLPPGDIELTGLSYGFIGGTCGLLSNNVIAFYGNLDFYKYGNEVLGFLDKHEVKPIYLNKGKLIDRGSIFCLK